MITSIKASNFKKNFQPPPLSLYIQWNSSKNNNISSVVDEKAKNKTGSDLFVFISNKPFLDDDISYIIDGVLVIYAQNIAAFLRTFTTANVYCKNLPTKLGTKVPVQRNKDTEKEKEGKKEGNKDIVQKQHNNEFG